MSFSDEVYGFIAGKIENILGVFIAGSAFVALLFVDGLYSSDLAQIVMTFNITVLGFEFTVHAIITGLIDSKTIKKIRKLYPKGMPLLLDFIKDTMILFAISGGIMFSAVIINSCVSETSFILRVLTSLSISFLLLAIPKSISIIRTIRIITKRVLDEKE